MKLFWSAAIFVIAMCADAATLQVVPGAYSGGKIYVSANFDGAKERCFLDTGSAMTLVASKRFAGYTNLGAFQFKSASAVAQETETIRIGSIAIDDITFGDVKVGRATFHGAENTIGIDLVGRQPFSLRFKPKPVLLLNAERPPLPSTTLEVLPYGLLSIPVTIGRTEVRALWDTGAAMTFLDQDLITEDPSNFKPTRSFIDGVDGAGKALLLQVFRAKKIVVGNQTFENVRIVANDLSLLRESLSTNVHAVIGFDLIRKFNWYFDPKKRLWKCER